MKHKQKGSRLERELLHMFWDAKWWCLRVAGSGSMPLPCPDLLAGKKGDSLAIECKGSKSTRKYITKEQIDELKSFAKGFGAQPWIGIRFNGMPWRFLKPQHLSKSNGKHYYIDKTETLKKSIDFKTLLQ